MTNIKPVNKLTICFTVWNTSNNNNNSNSSNSCNSSKVDMVGTIIITIRAKKWPQKEPQIIEATVNKGSLEAMWNCLTAVKPQPDFLQIIRPFPQVPSTNYVSTFRVGTKSQIKLKAGFSRFLRFSQKMNK